VAASLLAAAALAGCTADRPVPAPAATPPAGASPAPANTAAAWPAATPNLISTQPVYTPSAPHGGPATWDDASRQAAVEAAGAALAAFARPDLAWQAWYTGLTPLMDKDAAADYATVDPSNIPISAVDQSSCALAGGESSAYLALVECGTDGGAWQVLETRLGQTDPWLATSFAPADR
jgi:hypothetical protein